VWTEILVDRFSWALGKNVIITVLEAKLMCAK